MSALKKHKIGFAIWLLLLLAYSFAVQLSANAESFPALPKQTGNVTDPIGLFSAADAKKIADSSINNRYDLIVLTARGLNEKAGGQLANDAYDGWKLKPHQLMLVVTVEPNFVHLVYDNAELNGIVAANAARSAKGIVDSAFVPFAGSGKVAEGVIAVGHYVNALPAAATTENSRLSSAAIAGIAAGIVALLLVLFAARQLLLVARSRKMLNEAAKIREEAEVAVSRLIVSNLLKELEMGFMQGETKIQVSALERSALELQRRAQELQNRQERQRVSFRTSSADERSARTLRNESQTFAEQAGQAREQLERLEKLSSQARNAVAEIKRQADEAAAAAESLERKTSFPLPVLKRQLEEARTVWAAADSLDEFDFVRADTLAKQAEHRYSELMAGMELMGQLAKRYLEYVPRIRDLERQLRLAVERERLLLTDADPFRLLRQAETELPLLASLLEAGDAAAATAYADRVDSGLQNASDVVDEMVANRDFSADALAKMERYVAEINGFSAAYGNELEKLRARFAEVHLREQEARFTQTKQADEEIRRLQGEVRRALDPDVQLYRLARESSERARHVLTDAYDGRERCLAYRNSLEEMLRTASERYNGDKRRFRDAVGQFEQLDMKMESLRSMIADGVNEITAIDNGFRSRAIDVSRLGQRVDSFAGLTANLNEQVHRLAAKKAESMRRIAEGR